MGAEDEDLETHYNLGVAFREMGLLEEAIGEFQKVAKANDRGKAFRYAMQCSTLLGLAFMEKGQPEIAAIWYERALTTPGLDSESKLALRYDLGVAQDRPAIWKRHSRVSLRSTRSILIIATWRNELPRSKNQHADQVPTVNQGKPPRDNEPDPSRTNGCVVV